jgi:hypothetical protein
MIRTPKYLTVRDEFGGSRKIFGAPSEFAEHVVNVIESGLMYPGLTTVDDTMELFRSNLVFVSPTEAIIDMGRNISIKSQQPIGIKWVREDVKEPLRHLRWVLYLHFSADSDILADWELGCLPSH